MGSDSKVLQNMGENMSHRRSRRVDSSTRKLPDIEDPMAMLVLEQNKDVADV